MALRTLTEGAHSRLAQLGHPGTRPAHAFAFQTIGTDGTTAGELARAQADYAEARERYLAARALFQDLSDRRGLARSCRPRHRSTCPRTTACPAATPRAGRGAR